MDSNGTGKSTKEDIVRCNSNTKDSETVKACTDGAESGGWEEAGTDGL